MVAMALNSGGDRPEEQTQIKYAEKNESQNFLEKLR